MPIINGCKAASKRMKSRHQHMRTEYCREHCSESSCDNCIVSGGGRLIREEVENMPIGVKECPGCHEMVSARGYQGHTATCEKYALYVGVQETQGLEETPEEPAVAEEPEIQKPEKKEEYTPSKTLLKSAAVILRDRSVPAKAPDTKTKPQLLFTIDFPDNTDYELIAEVCDHFVGDEYSCTLRGCRIFEFRK